MGEVLPKIEIHLTSTEGTYYVYDLTNVMITNYSISGFDSQIPTEEISLNYEKTKRLEISGKNQIYGSWKTFRNFKQRCFDGRINNTLSFKGTTMGTNNSSILD